MGDAEDDLLGRVRAGEEEAARAFFRMYHPAVARIVRNHSTGRHGEEDLCQMIFARVFANLDQYAGRVPVAHWISRIAVNTCVDEWKRERRRQERPEADLGADEAELIARVADAGTDEEAARREAREVVRRLLERLEPMDRMVISLLHLDQRSVAETSALTGLPQAVVKIRAFRARRKLQKLTEPLAGKYL